VQRSHVVSLECLQQSDRPFVEQILNRVIRVDHVLRYKLPKEVREKDEAAEKEVGPFPFVPERIFISRA
jgi:hypothetical protein